MTPAHVLEITTPKKVLLNGLWFGPTKPKRVVVWVHGLTSSLWSRHSLITRLIDKDTAVLMFNNRGHDTISRLNTDKKRIGYAGGAHEVFTECVDDIQGAVATVRKQGVKNIYLAGHSTGCQKSIYWAHRHASKGVKGIILLAPLSDYASVMSEVKKLTKAVNVARQLVARQKKSELLPTPVWHETIDAQRFLSLYTPDSVEQSIFPYFDSARKSRVFSSVKVPMLAFFAREDEYADRPAEKIAHWFAEHAESTTFEAHLIPKVGHSFKGGEDQVVRILRAWFKAL